MMSVDSRSGQHAHAQQPRQAAVMALIPLREKKITAATAAAGANFFPKRYKGYFY